MVIVPEVISTKPASMLSSVVFPQPESPTRQMNSPSSMLRFTPSKACTFLSGVS